MKPLYNRGRQFEWQLSQPRESKSSITALSALRGDHDNITREHSRKSWRVGALNTTVKN